MVKLDIDVDDDYYELRESYRDSLNSVLEALDAAIEEADNLGDTNSVFVLQELYEQVQNMFVAEEELELRGYE